MKKPKKSPQPDLATIGGIVGRQILSAAGGFAVAKGYVDAETATQIVGALVTIGAGVWSYNQKKRALKG